MADSIGESAWKLTFQLSPIILSGGLASSNIGGYLPIIAITELINFPAGLLSGMQASLDSFFANFRPLPGSTIIEQEVGHYPFANQGIAANTVIAQPRQISFEMLCPAQTKLGFYEKLAIMEALEGALDYHTQMGGTYILMTPSKIYTSCLLRAIRDTSGQLRTGQPQVSWQWDFEQPLLTASDLGGALNSLYDWINRQTQMPDVNSGLQTAVSAPQSLGTAAVMPSATPVGGAGITSVPLPPLTPPVTVYPSFTVPGTVPFQSTAPGIVPPGFQ
jgi:hypothetical protein